MSTDDVVVVLDGATVRTDTGCEHGVPWYVQHLGPALINGAAGRRSLTQVLADAIRVVAAAHPGCDLTHPGTPSASVGMVRAVDDVVQYLTLGDVSLVLDLEDELRVITDDRISQTALEQRKEADRYPIGSPDKQRALLAMKPVELAARNRDDGYWIAAADPAAADHAITGDVPFTRVRRLGLASDGAARAVAFGLVNWREALDLAPEVVIEQVRKAERHDPKGIKWPRNKASDDATLASITAWRQTDRDSGWHDDLRPFGVSHRLLGAETCRTGRRGPSK